MSMVSKNRKLRILHLCWEYPPLGSGVGRYFEQISLGLRIQGHFSVLVTSRSKNLPEEEELHNGMIYRVFDVEDIGSPDLARKVLDIAKQYQVDVIEAADHLGEASELLSETERPPVLINCRYNDVLLRARNAQAYYKWQYLTIALACLRNRSVLQRERYSIENADLLAAPSSCMLDALRSQGIQLPARRTVLPKPLSLIPDWNNQEADRPTILFVGRVDMGKGIGYLPKLLGSLIREYPDLVLKIAGGDSYARLIGSCKQWLEKRLKTMMGSVRFLGHLAPAELDEAYRRAWVVIIPSRWDTSPTSVLESMVRHKAIVSSPHGGMPEYLKDTYNTIADPSTASFADAVSLFLGDAELRKSAGESGARKAAEFYTPDVCAEKYIDFIRQSL